MEARRPAQGGRQKLGQIQTESELEQNQDSRTRIDVIFLVRKAQMNPLLVREVQPPLIYVGGDGRLNNTQSNKSIYYFFIYVLSLHRFFYLVLRCSSCLRATNPEARGASESTQGSPQPPHSLTGSLPGVWGFRVCKSARRLSCVSRCRSGLLRRELRCITPGVEGTRDVFVCQHNSSSRNPFKNAVLTSICQIS